jgi:hypothetical protein
MSNSTASVERLDDTDPRIVCVVPYSSNESFIHHTNLQYPIIYLGILLGRILGTQAQTGVATVLTTILCT